MLPVTLFCSYECPMATLLGLAQVDESIVSQIVDLYSVPARSLGIGGVLRMPP